MLVAWVGLACDMAELACEAQAVVALRTLQIATGRSSFDEGRRMVGEKALACAMCVLLVGTGASTTAVVRDLTRVVRANRLRLTRAGP